MDELQAVRELFGEQPPPSPEVTAAARALLSPRRRPRRRLLLRVGLPVSAAAAAATAAVVAAVAIGGPGPAGPTPGGPAPVGPASGLGVYHLPAGVAGARVGTTTAGREILLTAARTVATQKPGTIGRYWVAHAVVGNFIRVGPAADRYTILDRTATQQWTATTPNAGNPDIVQALGVQLASAASRAAWRRDGSPTIWNVNPDVSIADPNGATNGFVAKLRAAAGKPTEFSTGYSGNGKTFQFGNALMSAHQLLMLPTNVAALKALILRGYSANLGYGSQESYLFQVTPELLTLPVTPAVRSALYQMLAGLPGVQSLGSVRDVGGQRGVAVALSGWLSHCGKYGSETANGGSAESWTFSSCVVQQRLVINPHSGLPLAQELRYLKLPAGQTWQAPDGLFSYQLFGSAYWTNSSPPDGF
jgi:hypothetical protein